MIGLIRESLRLVKESKSDFFSAIQCKTPEDIFKSLRNYGGWYFPKTKIYLPASSSYSHTTIARSYYLAVCDGRSITGDPEEEFLKTRNCNPNVESSWILRQLYVSGWVRIIVYGNQFGMEGKLDAISKLYRYAGFLLEPFKFAVINVDERLPDGSASPTLHSPFYLSDSKAERKLNFLLR